MPLLPLLLLLLPAGDLDPSTSPHHLVSLRTAYLKLQFLLDAGCIFIGHGLKQDFRMLNLTVPPEQVGQGESCHNA
jgi:PAB-dependent poly(A)-specific ribonuclease subunit 2